MKRWPSTSVTRGTRPTPTVVPRMRAMVLGRRRCRPERPGMVRSAIFIDAIVVKIRDGHAADRPIYAAIGVSLEGEKDVLGLWAGTGGDPLPREPRCRRDPGSDVRGEPRPGSSDGPVRHGARALVVPGRRTTASGEPPHPRAARAVRGGLRRRCRRVSTIGALLRLGRHEWQAPLRMPGHLWDTWRRIDAGHSSSRRARSGKTLVKSGDEGI